MCTLWSYIYYYYSYRYLIKKKSQFYISFFIGCVLLYSYGCFLYPFDPSILQTTAASFISNWSSQIVPHTPSFWISTRPWPATPAGPTNRMLSIAATIETCSLWIYHTLKCFFEKRIKWAMETFAHMCSKKKSRNRNLTLAISNYKTCNREKFVRNKNSCISTADM